MANRAIEAVVFDWYGTLAAPSDEDFWNRMPQIIENAGGHVEGLSEWEVGPIEHEAHSQSEEIYRRWQSDILHSLFERCGIPETRRGLLVEEISAIRYGRKFDIFPEVADVLKQLSDRRLSLGLCSNWDWDLDRHLHHNRIHGLFDAIICSASTGFRKPHPRIFETLIARMKIRPENMLFVGDSWPDDVEGSILAGFQPVHIARLECTVTEHSKALCIQDLNGIVALV